MQNPFVRARGAVFALAMCVVALASGSARAEPHTGRVAVGIAPHLLLGLTDSCTRDVDVVACSPVAVFAGADLGLWYQLLPALGLGARVAGSKDLDRSQTASSNGPTLDPEDQALWRTAAELRVSPLRSARGLWFSLAAGWTRLRERSETLGPTNDVVSSEAKTNAALVGVGAGYDVRLGRHFRLTPELRGDFIFFPSPPELRPGVTGHDYGTSFWLESALRLSYVF